MAKSKKSKGVQTAERYLRTLHRMGYDVSEYQRITYTKTGKERRLWNVQESDVERVKSLAKAGRYVEKRREETGINIPFYHIEKYLQTPEEIMQRAVDDTFNFLQGYEESRYYEPERPEEREYSEEPATELMIDRIREIVGDMMMEYDVGKIKKGSHKGEQDHQTDHTDKYAKEGFGEFQKNLMEIIESEYDKDPKKYERLWTKKKSEIDTKIAKMIAFAYYSENADEMAQKFNENVGVVILEVLEIPVKPRG